MIWLKSGIAAVVAAAAFAPAVCLSEIAETADGAVEVTRCNGLLPIASNVLLMVVMTVATFVVTSWWLHQRERNRAHNAALGGATSTDER